MKIIVQRSKYASCIVNKKLISEIDYGFVLLVAFHVNDKITDLDYVVNKVINLRIFDDANNVMNKSIKDVEGSVLSISQFTLYGNTKKGNRPSYINSMKSEEAVKYFDLFNQKLREYVPVKTGVFGADQLITINNNGPVTIIIDSNGE